jgi:HAD superfamily hydrolase (TIGR01549 family)
MAKDPIPRSADVRIWLLDFDNTLAALEREVDWAASRHELEPFLRAQGIPDEIFWEFPSRNLPLYDALLKQLLSAREMPPGCDAAAPLSDTSAALIRGASSIIEAHELRGVERAAPLPGAPELLKALRKRRRAVVVVTSNSSRTVRTWLEQNEVLAEVDAIVGRDTLLPLKPAPNMINRALQLSSGIASDAVFVGDSEADLEGSKRARVRFFAIAKTPESQARMRAQGAMAVFSSPHDLAVHFGFVDSPSDIPPGRVLGQP